MNGRDARRVAFLCLGLFVLAIAPYAQVAQHDFLHFDDDLYVFDNRAVHQGLTWDGVRWAFTTFHAGNWHPLTWLSHMLDVELFGLEPAGHHVTSVAIHATNTVLLAAALGKLTGALWRSVLVAALFAVHPLRLESVAWIAERKDVLGGLFWMLTMLAYAWYAKRPGMGRYLVVFSSLALGLMAKPMLVTLPFVLLLLDFWPLQRLRPPWARGAGVAGAPIGRLVLEKVPLIALAIASSVITTLAQSGGGAMGSLERLPLHWRLANAALSYVLYLRKTAWPFDLSVFYPHPALAASGPPGWFPVAAVSAALLLAAASVLAVREWLRRPYVLVGWFWYLGALFPTIGLVQVGAQSMADRYTYLPSIGLFIVVVWAGAECGNRLRLSRRTLALASALVLLFWAGATTVQARVWRDSQTLFEHAVRVTRDNYVMHNNLGNAYARKGDLERGAFHLGESLRIKPDYARAHNNLGVVWERGSNWREAARSYERATELDPRYAAAFHNLGNARQLLGDFEGAISAYERAIEVDARHADALGQLGALLAQTGDFARAQTQLERALRLDPGDPASRNNLGVVLRERGDLPAARTQFVEAVRLAPAYAEAYNNLGIVHAMQGDVAGAAEHFAKALELDPANAAARDNLERATRLQ